MRECIARQIVHDCVQHYRAGDNRGIGMPAAGQAVLHFARYAAGVAMIVREDSLKDHMSQYLINRIKTDRKSTFG